MDPSEIRKKIEKKHAGSVLAAGSFGPQRAPLFSVEPEMLAKVAMFLRAEPEVTLSWVENLSAYHDGSNLRLTYLLRAPAGRAELFLRVNLPAAGEDRVSIPSLQEDFPMIAPFESEVGELYGVEFTGARKAAGPWILHGGPAYPYRRPRGGTA